MKANVLSRRGLLQSRAEWAVRNRVLSNTLTKLAIPHIRMKTHRGLEVGCELGVLTDALASQIDLKWWGIDPRLKQPKLSPQGVELLPGWAHQLPFPDSHFDCVIFANVYEHVFPEQRVPALIEMRRVLTEGGILVGQLPNPYFPIESHSRLPFMGWLPRRLQLLYWRLTPVDWDHDFYVVTIKHLRKRAEQVGFETVAIQKFNYPTEAIPKSVRWAAQLLERPMRVIPWAWQFVFRKL